MDPKTAVIAGFDAISPLGTELSVQWDRALKGQSGIGPLTRFKLTKDFPVRVAGQVDSFDPAPYPFLSSRAMAHWTSPIYRHALLTVHRALIHSGIEIDSALAPRVAVTFSSAVGGQDAVLAADRKMIADDKLPHPFTNPNACINMVGGKVSMLTGATGPIVSTITACATGVTSMIMGAMLLEQGMADVVICGAVDFALVEPVVAGFYTMNGAFNPKPGQENESPIRASRPFSIDRRGFVISEGAAGIILCSHEFALAHGLDAKIALAGWAMTSDAHHFVAPNLPTVSRCINESLASAQIDFRQIAAVNAHAASTRIGDKVEYDALAENFHGRIPPITANKSLIGHAMGASSAIESVFTVLGMINSMLIPTINYTEDPTISIDCVAEGPRRLEQEFVLKNAFGFGGCNSCVVFQRIS